MVKFKKYVEKITNLYNDYYSSLMLPGDAGSLILNLAAIEDLGAKTNSIYAESEKGIYKENDERLNRIVYVTLKLFQRLIRALKYYYYHNKSIVTCEVQNFLSNTYGWLIDFLDNVASGRKTYKLLIITNSSKGNYMHTSNKYLTAYVKFSLKVCDSDYKYETCMSLDTIGNLCRKEFRTLSFVNFLVVPICHTKKNRKALDICYEVFKNDAEIETVNVVFPESNLDLASDFLFLDLDLEKATDASCALPDANTKKKPTQVNNYTTPVDSSVLDEIKKLKELLDMGAITEQEYQQAKSKLLSKL